MFSTRFPSSLVLLTASFLVSHSCFGQTNYTWNSAGTTSWSLDTNWSPVGIPGTNVGDTVSILNTTGSIANFDRTTPTTIAGMTIGTGPAVFTFAAASSKSLSVSGTLDNDGALVLRGSSSTQTFNFSYTGSAFSASSGRFVIDNDNNGSNGRDFNINIAAGNTNNATLITASRNSTGPGQNSQSYMNLTGSGNFTNANSVSVYSDRAGTNNDVALLGTSATYIQTGSTSATRVGGLASASAKLADIEVGSMEIRDGSFAGNGEVRAAGSILIGNGDVSGATLSVDPLSISGTGTTAAVSTGSGITTLNIGYQGGVATTTTNLTLSSDATLQLQLAPASSTSDQISLFGNFNLNSSATLALSLSGADAILPNNTKLLLADYTGTWNGTAFNSFADGSTFTLGLNQYRIDYDGNFDTGAFNGGTDMMLTVVPEPNVRAIFLLGLGLLLVRRRRLAKALATREF